MQHLQIFFWTLTNAAFTDHRWETQSDSLKNRYSGYLSFNLNMIKH